MKGIPSHCRKLTNLLLCFCGLHDHVLQRVCPKKKLQLPDSLAARYAILTLRLTALGPNLGEPHTKAIRDGLFCELRLKRAEGIARVFYRTLVGRRIIMLHSFIKKSEKTPLRELRVAEAR